MVRSSSHVSTALMLASIATQHNDRPVPLGNCPEEHGHPPRYRLCHTFRGVPWWRVGGQPNRVTVPPLTNGSTQRHMPVPLSDLCRYQRPGVLTEHLDRTRFRNPHDGVQARLQNLLQGKQVSKPLLLPEHEHVDTHVSGLTTQSQQVTGIVVATVTINVMNHLVRLQSTTNASCHDPPVHVRPPAATQH